MPSEHSVAVVNRTNWAVTNLKDNALGFTEFVFGGIRLKTTSGEIGDPVSFTSNGSLENDTKKAGTDAQYVAIREYIMNGPLGSVPCDTIVLCGRDGSGRVKCYDAWDYSDMVENPQDFYPLLGGAFRLDTPSDKNGAVIAGVVEINGAYHYLLSVAVQIRISEPQMKTFFNERHKTSAKPSVKKLLIDVSPNVPPSVTNPTEVSGSLSRCGEQSQRSFQANSQRKVALLS